MPQQLKTTSVERVEPVVVEYTRRTLSPPAIENSIEYNLERDLMGVNGPQAYYRGLAQKYLDQFRALQAKYTAREHEVKVKMDLREKEI